MTVVSPPPPVRSRACGAGREREQMSERTWAQEEVELVLAHEQRRARAERRRVKILWWTPASLHPRRTTLTGSLAQLWSGRRALEAQGPVCVGVYEATDPVGAPPLVVLRVRPGDVPQARGRALATVVGEARPGGVLVLETRHGTVVPVEPPAEPGDDAPPWSEVDADP
jgi:hypothetical protein